VSRVTAGWAAVCERYAVSQRLRAGASRAVFALACSFVWACALPDKSPTQPQPVQSVAPSPTADPGSNPTPPPVLGGPAPKATPSPSPSTEPGPSATPEPGTTGEGAAECGLPLPPPLSRFNVKVHIRGSKAWTLDSTPLVGPDAVYCAKVGYYDRSTCPVRLEGDPQRTACELYIVGRAVDTGRPGPTWYHGDSLCRGEAAACENHPDNQYLLLVYTGGSFKACGRNGVCGTVEVDK
jgi:hypothetical protein